jgi:stalled ribosome alternative rescue factor ArfA
MSWFIVWAVVIGYLVMGASRIKTYYPRWLNASKGEWSYRSEEEHHRSAAWCSVGLALIWPYYDAGRWARDALISHMTAEERARAEFEKAEKIVAEYTRRKEHEERDAFDKQLRGGKP